MADNACLYQWPSHACELVEGHSGDHVCGPRECYSTRPRNHRDVWRFTPEHGVTYEYEEKR